VVTFTVPPETFAPLTEKSSEARSQVVTDRWDGGVTVP
jgi:hypothetical protein